MYYALKDDKENNESESKFNLPGSNLAQINKAFTSIQINI